VRAAVTRVHVEPATVVEVSRRVVVPRAQPQAPQMASASVLRVEEVTLGAALEAEEGVVPPSAAALRELAAVSPVRGDTPVARGLAVARDAEAAKVAARVRAPHAGARRSSARAGYSLPVSQESVRRKVRVPGSRPAAESARE